MKTLRNYLIVFISASFAGSFTLRWLALEFLYHQMDDYWSGIGTTIVATGALGLLISLWLSRHLGRLERIVAKIRSGQAATPAERKEALGVFGTVIKITILANVIGFFIGQFIVMFLDVTSGVVPYHFSCVSIIMIQSILVGTIAALYEIYSLNIMMVEARKLLGLQSIAEFGKGWSMSIGGKISLSAAVTLLFMGVNGFSSAYGLIALPDTIGAQDDLLTYLRFGAEAIGFTFVVGFGLMFLISRELKYRIADTSARLKDLGEKGDLASRINLSMNDDFGAMTSDLNGFIAQLGRLVRTLRSETDAVIASSQSLAVSVGDSFEALGAIGGTIEVIEAGERRQGELVATADAEMRAMAESAKRVESQVSAQSTAVAQSSSSVNQMAANVESVAALTAMADALSAELTGASRLGSESIEAAVKAIGEIQAASAEVNQIVRVIQDIATRTNLLSMNAAIEAAHAGAAGRGFAIVAGEVRSLATSSAKSTGEIQRLINAMVDKINRGVESISAAGKSFGEITEGIGKTSDLMRTISSAMEEQRVGARETIQSTASVVEAIQTIQGLSRRQRESTDTMARAVAEIVAAERQIARALQENKEKSSALDASITKVKQSIDGNAEAVANVKRNIAVFNL